MIGKEQSEKDIWGGIVYIAMLPFSFFVVYGEHLSVSDGCKRIILRLLVLRLCNFHKKRGEGMRKIKLYPKMR